MTTLQPTPSVVPEAARQTSAARPAPDLHLYLDDLARRQPDQVVTIDRPIHSDQEITALIKKLEAARKLPVLIFTNVVGPHGRTSRYRLVMNLLASRHRCAEAMGTTFEQVGIEYYRRARLQRREPLVVDAAAAPVKEVVRPGDEVDLFDFPAMVHFRLDPGPYISAGFLTTYDPESGVDNCALQRGWIVNRNTVRCYTSTFSQNRINHRRFNARGEDTPVAFWIGHHPLAYLGGQARLPYPESHFPAIGGLIGEPLRLVPTETFGDKLLVPADAEVVIEGYLEANKLYPEGPFGEYTGYNGPQIPNPQMRVTAITHRAEPYWMNILVGGADNHWGSYAIEGVLYETVKARVPSLQNVFLPNSAMARFHAYLQLRDPQPGDAREAIMVALTTDYRLKHVFVFDDDIDIFNEAECLFALATRTQWDRDVMVFPGTRASPLDPSVAVNVGTKGGIDCTKPVGQAFSERNRVDRAVDLAVRVEDFIPASVLERIAAENM